MTMLAMTETTAPATPTLAQTIGRVAQVLASDHFPTGERARLKRLDPGGSPALVFYRFAFRHLPEGWENHEPAWMTLVAGIALMGESAHRSQRPVGQALAEAGYAEVRLERLLAADSATLHTLLLRAARFLAAKNASCNWVDFARLLLATDHERHESAQLAIARTFYRHMKDRD